MFWGGARVILRQSSVVFAFQSVKVKVALLSARVNCLQCHQRITRVISMPLQVAVVSSFSSCHSWRNKGLFSSLQKKLFDAVSCCYSHSF